MDIGWVIVIAISAYIIAYYHGKNDGDNVGRITGYGAGKQDGYNEGFETGKHEGYSQGLIEGQQKSVASSTKHKSSTSEAVDEKKIMAIIDKQLARLESELPSAFMSENGVDKKQAKLDADKLVEDLKTDLENNNYRQTWRIDSAISWLERANKDKVLKARYADRLEKAKRYISGKEFIPVKDKKDMEAEFGVGSAGLDWIISRLIKEQYLEPISKTESVDTYDGDYRSRDVLLGWAILGTIYKDVKAHVVSEGGITHYKLCDYLRKKWNINRTGFVAADMFTRLEKERIIAPKAKDDDASAIRKVLKRPTTSHPRVV